MTQRTRALTAALSAVLATVLGLAVTLVTPQSAQAASPAVSGAETALGVQIPGVPGEIRSEQSAQGQLPDGRYLAFYAASGGPGTPARFFAMTLDGRTVAEVIVPKGQDVLSLVYSPVTKKAYFTSSTTTDSFLYSWDGSVIDEVAHLSGQLMMRLAVAPDGDIYVGTFAPANGRLYVWESGVLRDLGQPVAGESYVRSLVADETAVWVSNYRERGATLVRVDRSSNARSVVAAPEEFSAEWAALDMSRAGDLLFLRTVNRPLLFAYNTRTRVFETFDDQVARVSGTPEVANRVRFIEGISPYGISPLIDGRYVYFQRSGAGLMRIDVAAGLKTVRTDKWNATDNTSPWSGSTVAGPVSYAWLTGVAGRSGPALVTTTIDGKLIVNGPNQTGPTVRTIEASGTPSTLISVGADTAGRVYTGGYNLPRGVGQWVGGAASVLEGPQIEGFGQFGSEVIMGGYTGDSTRSAPLYTYSGSGQPVLRTHINNSQERPVAITRVGDKVAIGTVPIKNTLGGALTLWDPATNALQVHRNIVPDQSVISLAGHGGLIVGGSSNTGGTGALPAAASGQIFTFDPTTNVTRTFTPPRAQSATYSWVAAITPDPSTPGRFWAISTGYLIQFAVSSDGSISLTRNLGAFPNTSSPTGKELGIEFVGSTMFATVDQGLSAINTITGERTQVAAKTDSGPVVGLARVGSSLYFARGAQLFRYTVSSASTDTKLAAPTVTSPTPGTTVAPGPVTFQGTGTRNSVVTLSTGSRTRTTVVGDGGTWSMGSIDFTAGTHDVTFTATLDGFAPAATTTTLSVGVTSGGPSTCPVAPTVTNLDVGGYNTPNTYYAFTGRGTPGSTVTMVNGTRTRSAVVRADGTWTMSSLWFGWWAGTLPFTARAGDCAEATAHLFASFVDKPTSHVAPIMTSHNQTTYYAGGDVVFSGKATPGAFVTLRVGAQVRHAVASSTGRWSTRAVAIGAAPVQVVLTSQLPEFSDTSKSVDVFFGTAPSSLAAPILTSHLAGAPGSAGDVTFSGKGTPLSKVTLVVAGVERSGFVRSSGRWDIAGVPVPAGTHDVRTTATAPGSSTVSSTVTVKFV